MSNTDDQRAAFEAWVNGRWSTDKIPDWSNEYKSAMTHVAWMAWQAAIEHAKKTMGERN